MSVLLIAGVPFDGSFWEQVQHRLTHHGIESDTWTICQNGGTFSSERTALHTYLTEGGFDTVVAHGLSAPLLIDLLGDLMATSTSLRIVLSNAFLTTDVGLSQWVLPQIWRIPCTIKQQLLRPNFTLPFLASSAVFRRLVVNPYVMDRATINKFCQKLLSSKEYRTSLCSYFRDLEKWSMPTLTAEQLNSMELHAIWGDGDLLFPIEQIETLNIKGHTSTEVIEGGAHFHPIERPWSIADALQKICTVGH